MEKDKTLKELTDGLSLNPKGEEQPYDIWISDDKMRADIVFHKPKPGQMVVGLAVLMMDLAERGITEGINSPAIEYALKNHMYERSLTFARGKMPLEGVDGWYEFLFEREFSLKPAIGKDGVADYHELVTFASVEKNQKLMRYHEAVPGKSGYDILGNELTPTPVRDLPRVPGKGFDVSPDGLEYVASFAGKAEFKQGRLLVTKIHEIREDVSTGTGNIFFDGTILIHGMVRSGMRVDATGDIIVDEVCEAAELVAGGDIICRKGVLGNKTGKLVAKGSVSAQFLDKVSVEAGNSIICGSAIQCELEAANNVLVTGDKGTLVGGKCYAFHSVECLTAGNDNMTRTVVSAGITVDMIKKYSENADDIVMLKFNAQEIKDAMDSYPLADRAEAQNKLHGILVKLKELQEIQRRLGADIKAAQNSKVVVHLDVNPGTVIELGGVQMDVSKKGNNVNFTCINGEIVRADNRALRDFHLSK